MDAVVTRMLTFCVSVCYIKGSSGNTDVNILRIRMLQNGCSGFRDANILRIRVLPGWMQHGSSHFAYPYATKMDAVVTRMLTFCVSMCYKDGCSGYTDVIILRIHVLQRWMQWLHGC